MQHSEAVMAATTPPSSGQRPVFSGDMNFSYAEIKL
jgi:hypothetical protein